MGREVSGTGFWKGARERDATWERWEFQLESYFLALQYLSLWLNPTSSTSCRDPTLLRIQLRKFAIRDGGKSVTSQMCKITKLENLIFLFIKDNNN